MFICQNLNQTDLCSVTLPQSYILLHFDRIVANQLSDSGLYRCRASNFLQITNIFVVIFDRIVASQLSDSGLYRCRASNSLGITLVEAAVTVVGKNAIIWFLDFTSTFSISTDQYFSLWVSLSPFVRYNWFSPFVRCTWFSPFVKCTWDNYVIKFNYDKWLVGVFFLALYSFLH